MVGLGGGTFTTLVHRALPDATIDAVEIDPVVVAAARAHFGLREDARYRVHVADAADWLRARSRQTTTTCCSTPTRARTSRRRWRTQAFFRAVARRLAPGGVVAINIAEMQAEGRAVARAFAAVLTPFDCRRTPSTATCCCSRPPARAPVDAAAMRRWLADWDARGVTDFSLAALAARPRRAACEPAAGAAVRAR